jgi:hypothetical protein
MGSTGTARSRAWLWGAAALALTIQGCAAARDTEPYRPALQPAERLAVGGNESLRIEHPVLAARSNDLSRRSPTWRAALDSIRATGFHVVIGTPADIRRAVPGLEHYRARHLGEVVPMRDGEGALIGAIVTIDLELVERLGKRAGLTRSEMECDVDRILVHEVYGHVLPLARTREIAGGCPDPAAGEPAASSCAIVRENVIRAELGLDARVAYDLSGLSLGRAAGAISAVGRGGER